MKTKEKQTLYQQIQNKYYSKLRRRNKRREFVWKIKHVFRKRYAGIDKDLYRMGLRLQRTEDKFVFYSGPIAEIF